MHSPSENILGIPVERFGVSGVRTGNIVSHEIAEKGYKTQYSPVTKKITVLDSSDLSQSILQKILYHPDNKYDGWYPVIEKERSEEGDFEIRFSCFRPLSEESMDEEEVALMEKSASECIVNAMSQFFNTHEMGKGIWYPDEYRKYLMDEFEIEMDENFNTGFANEDFFEKTGRFTFKLKNDVSAYEALLSFLEGPTVADCGNAIEACYYKCVLDIIGEKKFNDLFSSEQFALTIGQNVFDENSPISLLADFSDAAKRGNAGVFGKRPLKIGEVCHFGGVIWYGNKHPKGSSGGWNVVYVGDDEIGQQLFMAHGFEKPLTEKEIIQKLVELYNSERTPQEEQYLIQAKKPALYDREVNRYLKSHYVISNEEIEKTPSKFIKGFLAKTISGLQINKLIRLKNANNVVQYILCEVSQKVENRILRMPNTFQEKRFMRPGFSLLTCRPSTHELNLKCVEKPVERVVNNQSCFYKGRFYLQTQPNAKNSIERSLLQAMCVVLDRYLPGWKANKRGKKS